MVLRVPLVRDEPDRLGTAVVAVAVAVVERDFFFHSGFYSNNVEVEVTLSRKNFFYSINDNFCLNLQNLLLK